MTVTIEQLLARAVLARRPHTYSQQEIEAAEQRIAAGIGVCAHRENGLGGGPPPDCPTESSGVAGEAEARSLLEILCRTVVEQNGALQHMGALLGRRIPQPDGARVLGCALQLAGQEESARFWWQFAAGAGDGAAAYCLYLHHLTLGEEWEAELWHRQADPAHHPHPDEDELPDGSSPGLVLRVLALLHRGEDYLTEAASAVIHYLPDAVQFVDEIELPLPTADFAQRIEELTATG
ncbi:hypothetical protein FH609_021770 [Streptomyces sp. 3MP-14]|uniref:Tetratricopeptide repeat protein n=1 Tax=Streptomyces mimosae TaxID=2586635 RepID=A0A5N6A641_9ACTN|nr:MULTISPECIES: hypothetical protein [Streptomyces]KAB8163419.1 hypothetical protein FH607_019185 [Streptomyces mimosae]KAB8174696.1 hypothetical protein FH609_021770 [Streptomyces sp. 3MP-14]